MNTVDNINNDLIGTEKYIELYLNEHDDEISLFDSLRYLQCCFDKLKDKDVCISKLLNMCTCIDFKTCNCTDENYIVVKDYKAEELSSCCLFSCSFVMKEKIKRSCIRLFTLDRKTDEEVVIFDLMQFKNKIENYIKFYDINKNVIFNSIFDIEMKNNNIDFTFNYMLYDNV